MDLMHAIGAARSSAIDETPAPTPRHIDRAWLEQRLTGLLREAGIVGDDAGIMAHSMATTAEVIWYQVLYPGGPRRPDVM
jgi:hypothetical protein